jgi:hypothetical protein
MAEQDKEKNESPSNGEKQAVRYEERVRELALISDDMFLGFLRSLRQAAARTQKEARLVSSSAVKAAATTRDFTERLRKIDLRKVVQPKGTASSTRKDTARTLRDMRDFLAERLDLPAAEVVRDEAFLELVAQLQELLRPPPPPEEEAAPGELEVGFAEADSPEETGSDDKDASSEPAAEGEQAPEGQDDTASDGDQSGSDEGEKEGASDGDSSPDEGGEGNSDEENNEG